jgi:hypothetical protein
MAQLLPHAHPVIDELSHGGPPCSWTTLCLGGPGVGPFASRTNRCRVGWQPRLYAGKRRQRADYAPTPCRLQFADSAKSAITVGRISSVARKRTKPGNAGAAGITIMVTRLYVAGRLPVCQGPCQSRVHLSHTPQRPLRAADRGLCEYPQRAAVDGVLVTGGTGPGSPSSA